LANRVKYIINECDENFPKLKEIFSGDGVDVKAVLNRVTSFRTDLNRISDQEFKILHTMGYTASAFRFRLHCAPYLKSLNADDIEPLTKFNARHGVFDAKFLFNNLTYSDSMIISFFINNRPKWFTIKFVSIIIPFLFLLYLLFVIERDHNPFDCFKFS